MNKNMFLFFFLSTLFFVGCDKDTEDAEEIKGDPVALNVMMGAMESFGGVSTRSANPILTFTQPLDSTYDTGIDVITTVEEVQETPDIKTRASVANNVRFRMVVYNSNGSTVTTVDYNVVNNVAVLASGQTAPVLAPGTYKFLFYTYNRSSLPALEDGKAAVFTWDDYATNVVTKTISAQDYGVTVNFKRHCCKLALEYVAIGFSDNSVVLNNATLSYFAVGYFPINSSVTDNTNLTLGNHYSNHVYYEPTYVVPLRKEVRIWASITIEGIQRTVANYLNADFQRRGNYKITFRIVKK